MLNKGVSDEDPETDKAASVGQRGNLETTAHARTGPREMIMVEIIETADSVRLSDDHNNYYSKS